MKNTKGLKAEQANANKGEEDKEDEGEDAVVEPVQDAGDDLELMNTGEGRPV